MVVNGDSQNWMEGKSSGDFLVDVPLNQSVDTPSTIFFRLTNLTLKSMDNPIIIYNPLNPLDIMKVND